MRASEFQHDEPPLILVIVRDAYKILQASRHPPGWLKMKNLDALAVEKKTASELAEIVATRIGISAAAIKVMPDPVYGWRAMVIGPRDAR